MNDSNGASSRSRLLLGAFGFGCILLAVWLIPQLEFRTETEDLGWSPEAKRNSYLAAEQFLQKLDISASSNDRLQSLRELPSTDTSLVVSDQVTPLLTLERAYDLLSWVEDGGRLVLNASQLSDGRVDHLLNILGLEVQETDCYCFGFVEEFTEGLEDVVGERAAERVREEAEAISDELAEELDEPGLLSDSDDIPEGRFTRMLVSGQEQEIQVYFNPNYALYPADEYDNATDQVYVAYEQRYTAGSDFGNHLVQYRIGEGVLTVLSDETIWLSDEIGDYDHAYLLWYLHRNSSDVMFVYGSSMPDLFSLLWQSIPELVISFIIFLIAWLFYRGRRFGPIQIDNQQERRALIEHQQAVGQFLWQRKQAMALLEPLRKELISLLRKRFPGFDRKTPRQQSEFLEQTIQVPAVQTKLALYQTEDMDADQFTDVIAAIQTIRNRV